MELCLRRRESRRGVRSVITVVVDGRRERYIGFNDGACQVNNMLVNLQRGRPESNSECKPRLLVYPPRGTPRTNHQVSIIGHHKPF